MRLLVFNLVTDADDPVLGFTTLWLQALAERIERVEVITMRKGRLELPSNVFVRSVGKERGFSEPRRVVEFYRHLSAILRDGRVDMCFSHMIPIFSVLAGPLLRALDIPIVTWYAHAAVTRTLRAAHAVSDRMVTSVASAYRYRPDKLIPLGQGIDARLFHPTTRAPADPPEVVYVSRLSRVKDQAMLLRAVRRLADRGFAGFEVRLLGPILTADDARYAEELKKLVGTLALGSRIKFLPPQPVAAMPGVYRRATVNVNLTPIGSFDKTALEAMFCGSVTIVANPAFADTLGQDARLLLLPARDEAVLADRIEEVLCLAQPERDAIARRIRERCEARHSLDSLVDKLVAVFGELLVGDSVT